VPIKKFSQVAAAGANPASTANLVGYDSTGPTDYSWTLPEVQGSMWASPIFTGTVTTPNGATFNSTFGYKDASGGIAIGVTPPSDVGAGILLMTGVTTFGGSYLDSPRFHVSEFTCNQYATNVSSNKQIDTSTPSWALSMQAGFRNGMFLVFAAAGAVVDSDRIIVLAIDQYGQIITPTYTVATLPAGTAGGRLFVTDSNLTMSGNFGANISGHGTGGNTVPVFFDGANWLIG
jgi:hypothetical protein